MGRSSVYCTGGTRKRWISVRRLLFTTCIRNNNVCRGTFLQTINPTFGILLSKYEGQPLTVNLWQIFYLNAKVQHMPHWKDTEEGGCMRRLLFTTCVRNKSFGRPFLSVWCSKQTTNLCQSSKGPAYVALEGHGGGGCVCGDWNTARLLEGTGAHRQVLNGHITR